MPRKPRPSEIRFNTRPFADPEVAALKIVDLANAVEPYFDNRILIEKINGPFLYELRGTPAEYKAGLDRAIEKGWLVLRESGTFVKFTPAGVELFRLKRVGTKGLAMRSEVHAMAATVFICAAVSISQASAYPSIVAVASPPTDVSASRHHTHHRRYIDSTTRSLPISLFSSL